MANNLASLYAQLATKESDKGNYYLEVTPVLEQAHIPTNITSRSFDDIPSDHIPHPQSIHLRITHPFNALQEAKKGYHRAIEGFGKALGQEHKLSLTAWNNLAILLFQEVKMKNEETRERRRGKGGHGFTWSEVDDGDHMF